MSYRLMQGGLRVSEADEVTHPRHCNRLLESKREN